MAKLSVKNLDVKGKKVLVRCDFNVPLDDSQNITDDARITGALPTIKHLIGKGAKVILCSHLGRPKGQVVPAMSLAPVAKRLSELLGFNVPLAPDCIGGNTEIMVGKVQDGGVLLLENVRFHKEEDEKPNKETNEFSNARWEFTKKLASLGQVYVNDAFGTAHRDHASTCGVTRYLNPAAAGFLIDKELKYLNDALETPKRPLVAILGGSKVGSKIGVIRALLGKVDYLIIGGGMTYTFFKAQGKEIGKSLFDEDSYPVAQELLKEFESAKAEVVLPVDVLLTDDFKPGANTKTVDVDHIDSNLEGVDIGVKTIAHVKEILGLAGTVVWNGPVGVFEIEDFARGTREIAEFIASRPQLISIIGGGDTASAVAQYNLVDKMSHVSTGGGASLEFLEGVKLPGIEALNEA
ncbi:MAG: phosphoglycerate kinase [Sumerlaeia bacterium]